MLGKNWLKISGICQLETAVGLIHGGAMTATELGERIGETPTTCSFHLRQLAKYGFVEEAGGGHGRSRPWRMTSVGWSFAPGGDPAAELASAAALRLFRERSFARYETWRRTRTAYSHEWQEAADPTAVSPDRKPTARLSPCPD